MPSTNQPIRRIPLAQWKLIDADPGAGLAWNRAPLDHQGMIDAGAPGDIYLALHAAGRLPHPFADRAEAACAWVSEREWWYRIDVTAPACGSGQRVILEFEGLDTFASVWFNGEHLGAADNMFRAWRFDVTHLLRPGANQVALCFTPPALAITPIEMPPFPMASSPSGENKRNFMRKAQFGWGWDFAPYLVTVGIWKAACLKVETRALLEDVMLTTLEIAPGHGSAQVAMTAGVDAFGCAQDALSATFSLRAPDGSTVVQSSVACVDGVFRLAATLDQPKLWWTPELGAANLYSLDVVLEADGVVVGQRSTRVGVRTIVLDTSPDPLEPGARFFRFVLNGVPIFARGVNWVPPSSLVAAIDDPLYGRLLTMAASANMNMVRVWGGGIYEHDAFYDRCDELGLLVWQDFMFACAPYPEHDPRFVENVRREVEHQVRRLRHHACLALWCGNNECQAIQGFANSKAGTTTPILGELFYDQVIPDVLARLDPITPYHPGSPFGGPVNNHNSMMEGDIHDWTVWHGLPTIPLEGPVGEYDRSPAGVAYTRYAEDLGRFISEYGIQSAPGMATFRRALPPSEQTLGSAGFLNRIKDRPNDKVNAMLISVTGLPATLEDYVGFTQINQAEGLAFGIEHFRRRKPHCSGSLLWQFNDCWPGISWSIVDYYGFAKAGYHYVRRAYAPVAASFKAMGDGIELWLVNDTLKSIEGEAQVSLDTFDALERGSTQVAYTLAANSSGCIWRAGDTARCGNRHVLSVRSPTGQFPANQHLFVPVKDLARSRPRAPLVTMARVDHRTTRVTLTASDYLYFVHLLSDDEAVTYDDNYLSLRAGESRTITATYPDGMEPPELSVRWR